MRLLIDTHLLLWAIAEPQKLPESARERLESTENDVLFSPVSLWELAIKLQIGRLDLPVSPDDIARAASSMGFEELPVTSSHAAAVIRLPLYHRDPFDRLLVAQAMQEPARFLTVDRQLGRYSEMVEVLA